MSDQTPSESAQTDHTYLDAGPSGPRRWMLLIGALFFAIALVAAFYGLYTINRTRPSTPSPDSTSLAQSMAATPQEVVTASPNAASARLRPTAALTGTQLITSTVEPPTYTVRQGDSLIAIASRLNVNVNDLISLNQISGETIFPGQTVFVPPTVTPWPATGPFPHIVSQGETLISIAAFYKVTVTEIRALNGLTSDTIFAGQRLLIPSGGIRPPTPTPSPEPWQPAVITGDLDSVYSLETIKGHFTLHVRPDSRAAPPGETAKIAAGVEAALDLAADTFQRQYTGRLDVYVADSLFEHPYTPTRSYSLPNRNRLFLLYDGIDTSADQVYFLTYALTPLFAAQTLGEAASPLLYEGLASYVADQALTSHSRGYLSHHQLCAAFQKTEALPSVSRELTFTGQLGNMHQYLAAGCFVKYLIEERGLSSFYQLYVTADYPGVYGQTLSELENDWIAFLRDASGTLPFDAARLVRVAAAIDLAYRSIWENFAGTTNQLTAYAELNRARLSWRQGRPSTAQQHLDRIGSLLGDD